MITLWLYDALLKKKKKYSLLQLPQYQLSRKVTLETGDPSSRCLVKGRERVADPVAESTLTGTSCIYSDKLQAVSSPVIKNDVKIKNINSLYKHVLNAVL